MVWPGEVGFGAARSGEARHGLAWYGMGWVTGSHRGSRPRHPRAARSGQVEPGSGLVRRDGAWYGRAWHGGIWLGVVGLGLAGHGSVRSGRVWRGTDGGRLAGIRVQAPDTHARFALARRGWVR